LGDGYPTAREIGTTVNVCLGVELLTGLCNGIDRPPGGRSVRIVKVFMNRKNDMEERPDYLNSHVTAGVADKGTETDKINLAAENLLQGEQPGVESAGIEAEPKGQTFASRIGRYRPSLSAILATLAAFSLVSLFFFAVSVTSFFAGGRKSASRRRRR
jgi:hypothetical protein